MNCTIIQRRLLGAEDPAHPPDEVQSHLAGCNGCREWQALLLQMEQQVPLLPVPPSEARAEFLRRLLHTPVAGTVNGTGPPLQIRVPDLVRQRVAPGPRPFRVAVRHWMPIAGVAAALLLLVLGWRELVTPRQAVVRTQMARAELGPDQLVGQLMGHHLRLARQDLPPQGRANELAAMLNDVERELAAVQSAPHSQEMGKVLEKLQSKLVKQLSGGSAPQHSIVARSSQISPATADRLAQLQRNEALLDSVVDSSLKLAGTESDPFQRAKLCHAVVVQLAQEVAESAGKEERSRTVEMSEHLSAVLQEGMSLNLGAYRERSAKNLSSVVQRERAAAGDWALKAADALTEQLQDIDAAEVHTALAALRTEGRRLKGEA